MSLSGLNSRDPYNPEVSRGSSSSSSSSYSSPLIATTSLTSAIAKSSMTSETSLPKPVMNPASTAQEKFLKRLKENAVEGRYELELFLDSEVEIQKLTESLKETASALVLCDCLRFKLVIKETFQHLLDTLVSEVEQQKKVENGASTILSLCQSFKNKLESITSDKEKSFFSSYIASIDLFKTLINDLEELIKARAAQQREPESKEKHEAEAPLKSKTGSTAIPYTITLGSDGRFQLPNGKFAKVRLDGMTDKDYADPEKLRKANQRINELFNRLDAETREKFRSGQLKGVKF